MKAFDPDPKVRWLFCMTHPDDEIAICAWIHRLARRRAEVHISWTHSNPTRESEARSVAHLLGVPSGNLHFFGAPDGSVVDHLDALHADYAKLMAAVKPDRVCCGAFEQGHIDHDATNFLVNHTFDGPIFEIPFYHTYLTRVQVMNRFADPAGEEVRVLRIPERRLKTAVARKYPSQNIWSVLVWYEVWQKTRLKKIELASTERMRLQTYHDFTRPNLPLKLASQIIRHPTWRRWERAVNAFKPQK